MEQRNIPGERDGNIRFGASRVMFLPAVVVAFLYGALWLAMVAVGRDDTALARMLLLVVVVGVPLLLLRAWMRYRGFGLRLSSERVEYRKGWLRPRWRSVDISRLSRVEVIYGPLGRYAADGALVLILNDGDRIRIADVAEPEVAARRIRQRLPAGLRAG